MALFQPSIDMTLPTGISIASSLTSFITLNTICSRSKL